MPHPLPLYRDRAGGRRFKGGNIMFTSIPRRFALTLPMLSALLVTLSGQPSPAAPLGTFVPAGSPGQANVMVGQAATVLSTAHYQAQLGLTCTGNNICSGNFPAVAPKRRLNLTRITCILQGSAGSTFAVGESVLTNANSSSSSAQFLPPAFTSSTGVHTINQAVDMQVKATQYVLVAFILAAGTFSSAVCTATGTLETLQ
jgi:hypothetical protein